MTAASPKMGCSESSSIIFSALPYRPGEEQRYVVRAGAHERGANDRERIPRAVPETLELVEDHDEMLGQRPQGHELRVERLRVLLGPDARSLDRAFDDPDVEPDLHLQGCDLALRGPPQTPDGVGGHRVVHAADEPGDAHDPLQVDLDHVEGRRVVAVRLGQLERELVRERRLARVTRAEERDVRLSLQRERHLVCERLHPDDLRGVVERAVPDEGVQRRRHRTIVLPIGTFVYRYTGTNPGNAENANRSRRMSRRIGNHSRSRRPR